MPIYANPPIAMQKIDKIRNVDNREPKGGKKQKQQRISCIHGHRNKRGVEPLKMSYDGGAKEK